MKQPPKELWEQIVAVYTGNASEEEKQWLSQWVDESTENRELFTKAIALYQHISMAETGRETGAIKARVWKKVQENRSQRGRQRKIVQMISAAASILLVLGVTLLVIHRPGTKPLPYASQGEIVPGSPKAQLKRSSGEIINLENHTESAIVLDSSFSITHTAQTLDYTTGKPSAMEYNTLIVPRGGEYNVVLPDGSRVLMNSDSELHFPIRFSGNTREVTLRGEAYFEVTTNAQKPFIVHTGELSVRALGTSFNVNAYTKNKAVSTTLETGKIEVFYAQQVYPVSPGEQFYLDKEEGEATVKAVDTELYTSWRKGYYTFTQISLEEILSTLSLWYDVEVTYQHEQFKKLRFTGKLKRFEEIQNLLNKFQHTGEVTFTIEGRNIIVKE